MNPSCKGKLSNCFSINQLVGQNIILQKELKFREYVSIMYKMYVV